MAIRYQLALWENVTFPTLQTVSFGSDDFSIDILRLDLMKGWASGNKYYKLKYTVCHLIENQNKHVVSKGGMFSNHLAALAEACHVFDIKLTCIVRTYQTDEENPSIRHLRSLGCDILYVVPSQYDAFDENESRRQYPNAWFIPEGGLSRDGLRGAGDMVDAFSEAVYDHILLAAGTMCTACGIIDRINSNTNVHIVPAWKGCTKEYVENVFEQYKLPRKTNWDLWPDYHFGGFGKFNKQLVERMTMFTKETSIPLDPVYNGKVVYALLDKLKSGVISGEEKVLMIHTGGLQGIKGYAYRFPEIWGEYDRLVKYFLRTDLE